MLVINFTCDVMHMPTFFPWMAIIACVARQLTFLDYLWTMNDTLDCFSFVIHERASKDRVKVGYTT